MTAAGHRRIDPPRSRACTPETTWYLIVAAVPMAVGVATSALRHLPCSAAMIRLVPGIALGPSGARLQRLDLERDAPQLRSIVEIALRVSLFAIGLRLRAPLSDRLWRVPCRVGLLAMNVTVPLPAALTLRRAVRASSR